MTTRLALLFASCAAMAAWPGGVRAAGVVGTGTPGSCTESALASALAGGGAVTFDCGPAPATIPLTAEQVVTATTSIDGGGLVTLSGQNATRLFRVPDAAAPGTGLTLQRIDLVGGRCPATGGVEPGLGGALWAGAGAQVVLVDVHGWSSVCDGGAAGTGGGFAYVRNGSLRLQRFDGFFNQARDGSAVFSVDSDVTIEDSAFNSSVAVRGGILLASGGRVTLRRINVLGVNATEAGGALHGTFAAADGGVTIEDSRMGGFAFGGDGGSIFHQGGPLRITRSSVTGTARRGGALFLGTGSVLDVSNTTFWSARAIDSTPGNGTGRGGAIFFSGASTGTIDHTTFGSNTADGGGGAFAGDGPSAVVLRASILEKNATGTLGTLQPSCSISLASGGFNVQDPGEPGDPDCAPGLLRAAPLLSLPGLYGGTWIFGIAAGSPAIDLVTSGCPPPTIDQRGLTRPQNFACDAGSFEWVPSVSGLLDSTIETNAPKQVSLEVRMSGAFSQTVTAAYATADGTATAGSDYVAAAGILTFPPGITTRTVPVMILGDVVPEPPFESFELRLGTVTGGAIAGSPGQFTIQDDDTVPSLSIGDCQVAEQGAPCFMTVRLSNIFGEPVTVSYASGGGTATPGADYESVAGTFTFAPGSLGESIQVPIVDDAIDELAETFLVELSAPQNATVTDGEGAGTIYDDDGPSISVGGASVVEGTGGTPLAQIPLTLSGPSVDFVTVLLTTRAGTALPVLDYVHSSQSVTFLPGTTSQLAEVELVGDAIDEPNELFRVVLSHGAKPSTVFAEAWVTIVDDDGGAFRVDELSHGATRRSNLANGRTDLFVVDQPALTSWEVVVDEASGDLGSLTGPRVDRLAADLTTVEQPSSTVGAGPARTLSWLNTGTTAQDSYIRVESAGCGTDCGPDDVYRIRAYDTTLRAARFNCAAPQRSILLMQNTGTTLIVGHVAGWVTAGTILSDGPFVVLIEPGGTVAAPVCSYLGFEGAAGSLTVAHNGRYGQLVGKVVQIDPATGATFDTPLTTRPR